MSLQTFITNLTNIIKPNNDLKKDMDNVNESDDNDSDNDANDDGDKTKKKIIEPLVVSFWGDNPNILLDFRYVTEFFPTDMMTYDQKLNAVTRTVLVLTMIGFYFSRNVRILLISAVTLLAIFLMRYYKRHDSGLDGITEGFLNQDAINVLNQAKIPIKPSIFEPPSSQNPLSNVLVSDYTTNVHRKPAPPAFNQNVNDDILNQTKTMISQINSDQPDINEKLFRDLGEDMNFEQSMRQFHSNPSTTIPGDQSAFAEFCYGSMVSCKEGNLFACARNKINYTNY